MVRTAGTAIKSTGGKSSKGSALSGCRSSASFSAGSSTRSAIGGNKLVQRPIPGWQKPIGNFFKKPDSDGVSSSSKQDPEPITSEQDSNYIEEELKTEDKTVDNHVESENPDDGMWFIDEDSVENENINDCLNEVQKTDDEQTNQDKENNEPNHNHHEEVLAKESDNLEDVNAGASSSSAPDPEPKILKRKLDADSECTVKQVNKKPRAKPKFHLLERFEQENAL